MSESIESKKSKESNPKNDERRLGIYFLPNLFTTGALFSGFYAVVASMNHHYGLAAFAIVMAMILDSLDGRVARLINAQSLFGAHYDSLADIVSFGVAPALLLYNWSLIHLKLYGLGKVGWLCAFLYVACVALRLAKFNSMSHESPLAKRYFFGLPCPAPAGFIATVIWLTSDWHMSGLIWDFSIAIMTVILALLMVSNIHYRSFKDVKMNAKVGFFIAFLLVIIIACIALAPIDTLFGMSFLYVISGPFFGLVNLFKKNKKSK